MPGQQGVRRHNRGDVPQDAPSDCLGFRRQTPTLIVREPQTSRAELFPQGAVLFLEILDHLALLLVHPAGECDEHETQRRRQRDHGTQAAKDDGHRLRGSRSKSPDPATQALGFGVDRVIGQYGRDGVRDAGCRATPKLATCIDRSSGAVPE
jgi:hypothetical protein